MPCMQPTEIKPNRITNKISRMVLVFVQPLRQSKSANNTETAPVSNVTNE